MKRQIKVGINGLGRIGRQIFHLLDSDPLITICGINEINPDLGNWIYTLSYDTIYGRKNKKIKLQKDLIETNNNLIKTSFQREIHKVPWEEWGVEIIIDCSGVKTNVYNSRKIIDKKKVRKIIVTHSPDEVDFTMVLGVNEDKYNTKNHNLISSSICDATAIAPITQLIHNAFHIESGYVTTLHPWLSYQNLMDGPSSSWSVPGQIFHHYALGRSSVSNMIPKPTSAMDAVFKVISSLSSDQIGSFSYRTPMQIIGSADLTYNISKSITKKDLVEIFEEFEKTQKFKIIKISEEPLVSSDFIGEDYSVILDSRWTDVINGNLIKIVAWYDNEYGYASKVISQLKLIADQII